MSEAANSNADTSQFHKIAASLKASPVKDKTLPKVKVMSPKAVKIGPPPIRQQTMQPEESDTIISAPLKKAQTQSLKLNKEKRKEMINEEDQLTGDEVLEYLKAFRKC